MIKKIFHISDTHIHLYRKLKQQKQVFENLFKELRDKKDQYSIIVVTGDVFHSKTELSPEAISMANKLFIGLSNLLPTIVIAGNHDANLSNSNRLDAISPVIQSLDNKNIHYYRETGWYEYQNINFWVSSVFDQRLPNKKEFKKDKTNILLYHGMVQKVNVNNVTMSGRYKLKEFENFDYVLLGDIHKHQVLSTTPLTAYAGSLMQLNFGQETNQHGMIQWDIENNKLQHIQIHNDYKYYNVIIQNGQLIQVPKIDAKYPKVKLKYKNTTLQRVRQLQRQLRKDYNIQEFMLSKVSDELQLKSSSFKYSLQNLDNVQYQQKLIKEYIQHSKLQINEDMLSKVFQLNRNIINQVKLNLNKVSFNQNLWTIDQLQFSNFFSYGQNNYIDFRQYNGIVGITGTNRSGKSSLLQIILFMLYDKTSKTHKSLPVLNKLKNKLYGKISLSLNGKKYFIQKQGIKNVKYNTLPIKIKFYTIDQNGQQIDLSGTQRNDTNAIIQSYIGSYEDAMATFFSTQKNENAFIEMTSGNRKSQLNSLFNLTIFDDSYKEANQQSKQLKGYFKNIDIDKYKDKKQQSKQNNILIKKENKKLQKDIDQLTLKLNNTDLQLKLLIQQRQKEQEFDIDINFVQNNINKYINDINELNKQKLNSQEKIKNNTQKIIQLEQIMQTFDYENYSLKRDKLFKKIKQLQSIQNNVNNKNIIYKKSLKQVKLLSEVQYDQNCEYCMNNPLTKNAIQEKNNINILQNEIKQLNNKLVNFEKIKEQYKDINDNLTTYDKDIVKYYNNCLKISNNLNNDIINISKKINQYNDELLKTTKIKDTYIENENIINQNLKILNNIKKLEKIQNDLNIQKKKLQNTLLNNKIKLNANQKDYENATQIIKEYTEKANLFQVYQIYKTIMSRNGLQYYIITNIVSTIQKQMNEVLHTFANFSVEFSMDGSSLDINIIYPDKEYQIQLCSGFERFMVSIALRHTLSIITNKSKSKMFIIDEGFGVLDGQNVLQFDKIFEFISDKYQTLLLISHLDVMRSMLEDKIQIQYKNGESKIL